MTTNLIPGYHYGTTWYPFTRCGWASWEWYECLGVALSMAGALSLAYSRGYNRGSMAGWDDGWDAAVRNGMPDMRF